MLRILSGGFPSSHLDVLLRFFGAIYALKEQDLKKLLAYSSIDNTALS
jgi:formate hydrogenlyase subunit 3/multisubunit Na+/H+ antiporter MnhD subunit